jgi:hypothetical protein
MKQSLGFGMLALSGLYGAHDRYTSVQFLYEHPIQSPWMREVFIMSWTGAVTAALVSLYLVYKYIVAVSAQCSRTTVRTRVLLYVLCGAIGVTANTAIVNVSNNYLWPVSTLAIITIFAVLFGGFGKSENPDEVHVEALAA